MIHKNCPLISCHHHGVKRRLQGNKFRHDWKQRVQLYTVNSSAVSSRTAVDTMVTIEARRALFGRASEQVMCGNDAVADSGCHNYHNALPDDMQGGHCIVVRRTKTFKELIRS
jgi:hypothetical protein